MRKIYLYLTFVLSFFALQNFAQGPSNMNINQDVSNTHANSSMTLKGTFFQGRFLESTTTTVGTRKWQFNTDSYFNTWGSISTLKTLAGFNTVIPIATATASGNFQASVGYTDFGRLPITTSGRYYTYNIIQGASYASQLMGVLETAYNPVDITTVAAGALVGSSLPITITPSATPNAAEYIYVRYSTDNFVTSSVVLATGSATTWTANIPLSGSTVKYYVYTSPVATVATINSSVTTNGQAAHDILTLNLNNNAGPNYTYTTSPLCNSNGAFTIDNTIANNATSTGGNFSSFSNAINYINVNGICGALTFNVTAGQTFAENPPALTATGTMANPIIFQKTSGTNPVITPIVGTGSLDFGICISGGDYITFDGIDINASTATSTNLSAEFGYLIRNASATNGAQNNTIKNVTITLNKNFSNSSAACIYSSVSTSQGGFTPTAVSGANSNNKYYNLTLSNAQNGVWLVGNTAFADLNNEVGVAGTGCQTARNSISNMGGVLTFNSAQGIRAEAQNGIKIFNNNIFNIRSNQAAGAGIYLGSFVGAINDIYNNDITDIANSGSTTSTSRAVGIELNSALAATNNARVYNNTISNITSPYTSTATTSIYAYGIFSNLTTNANIVEIDNNSVNLAPIGTLTYSNSCFAMASGSAIHKVRGNIFLNATPSQTGVAKHTCWASTSNTTIGASGSLSNYNNMYIVNATNGFVGRGSSNNYITVANWTAGITSPLGTDANSISVDPIFTSATNLHASANGINAVSGFTTQTWVTTDIDCQDRSTTSPHDIGADAVNACTTAVGGTSATTTPSRCVGQTVALTNTGATSGPGITYQWKVSTTSGSGYVNVTGGTGATTIAYTSAALTAGTYYYVLETTCTTGPVIANSNEVTVTVNALPSVTVSPLSATYCNPGGTPVSLTASGADTYVWSPSTGLVTNIGANVVATPSSTTTYSAVGTDANGCVATGTTVITVSAAPVISSATATPATICVGANSQLIVNSVVATPASGYSFTGSTGTYTALTSGTTLGASAIGDDVGIGNLPIGFTFNYRGTPFTVFGASSNGFIQLGLTFPTFTGGSSNILATSSNNLAVIWDDNNTTGASIMYATNGTAPNRVLTVQYTGMHVGNGGLATNPTINCQILLHETTGKIEYIYGATSAAFVSTSASIGISGAVGSFLSVTPLSPANTSTVSSVTENTTIAAAANFPTGTTYSFTPASASAYNWSPTTYIPSGQEVLANPLATAVAATTTYSVTATANGCTTTPTTVTVTVAAGPTITTEPMATTKCVGQKAFFKVKAEGPTLTYQWKKDGSNLTNGGLIGGATTDSLYIDGVVIADAGIYTCEISAACGSPVTTNASIALTVNPVPTATATSTTPACTGSDIVLTGVSDIGSSFAWSGPLAYTSTSKVSTVNSATFAMSGTYSFTATHNGCTSATATTVVVVNGTPTALVNTPLTSTICDGTIVTITSTGGTSSIVSSTIGNGITFTNATGEQTAFCNRRINYIGQSIFTKSELLSAGVNAGNITSIAYNILSNGNGTSNPNFGIKIGSVGSSSNFASTTFLNSSGYTQVFGPSTYIHSAPGWQLITFTTPFNWDGNSNIVIEVKHDGADLTSNAETQFTTTTDNKSLYGYNSPLVGILSLQRLNIQLGNKTQSAITWTPITNLYTDALATTGYVGGATATTVYAKPSTTTTYKATATSAAGCTISDSTKITVNPILVPSVTVAQVPTGAICAGTSVTFTATQTNGGAAPTYIWKKNGTPISGETAVTYTSTTLANGDIITVELTSNATPCLSPTTATSSDITMVVNPLPTLTGTVSVCVGNTTTLSGSATAATSNAYMSATTSVATVDATSGVVTGVAAGTSLITYTNSNGCIVTATVTVNALPTVTIDGLAMAYCKTASAVTLAGTPSGGTFAIDGSTATSFDPAALSVGSHTVTYVYSDANSCTATATQNVMVNMMLPASVSISADNPSICPNNQVIFTAVPTNGGTAPMYQWKLNGSNVTGSGATYTTTTLANNDVVTVVMTSNATPCLTGSPATSNAITMNVLNVAAVPSVALAVNTNNVCIGTNLTFTATPTNSGVGPTYAWKKNGTIISGISATTYTTSSLANGDIITVEMSTVATACTSVLTVSSSITASVAQYSDLIINNPAAVCSPATVNITLSSVASNPVYPSGALIYFTTAAATTAYTSPMMATAGIYHVVAYGQYGCNDTAAVIVVVNILPNLMVTNPVAVCSPATIDLTAAAVTAGSDAGTLSYHTDMAGTMTYATPTMATTGTYYIKITNTTTGCVTIKPVTATVNALPTIVTTDPAAVCSPLTVNLTAAALTAGSSAGTKTYFTDAAASMSYGSPSIAVAGSYYIKLTDANGCSVISNAVTATVNPAANLVVTNPAAVCSPSTVDITMGAITTGSTMGTLSYHTDMGATMTYTTPTIATAGTYYVKLTSALGCTDIKPIAVTVNALPTLTGASSLCAGANATYTGSATAATTNAWMSSNMAIATVSATGVVTAGTTAGTTVITYTNANGCTATQTLNVNSNTTPTFTPVMAICIGDMLSALPLTSNNGITGTWSPALNNMATTTYTFTPTSGQCAVNGTLEIMVKSAAANIVLASTSTNTIPLVLNCQESDGFTYYTDPTDATKYIFGIEWGTTNAAAKASAVVKVQLDAAIAAATNTSIPAGAWTMKRFWDVTSAALATPVKVRFFYSPAEKAALEAAAASFNTANPTAIVKPVQWFKTANGTGPYITSGAGAQLTPLGVTGSIPLTDLNTAGATLNGVLYAEFEVTGFSGGTLGIQADPFNPLAANTSSITAVKAVGGNRVDWKLNCSATGNYSIVVEKANNVGNYTGITTIDASLVRCQSPFDYLDTKVTNGKNYYRLKITSPAGIVSYSKSVVVVNQSKTFDIISMVPTLVNNKALITIASEKASPAQLIITDVQGRIVYNNKIIVTSGTTDISIDASKFAQGTYQIQAISNIGKTNVIRFIKD